MTDNKSRVRFYKHGLTWIPAWIGNHMPCLGSDEIIYPFPNVKHRRSYHRGPWARAQTFFSLFLELIITVTWQWQSNDMQTLPSRWSTRIFINWRHSSTLLLSNLCREITRYMCWLAITVLLYMFHCNQWPHCRQEQAEDSFRIFHSEANTCVTVLWCWMFSCCII